MKTSISVYQGENKFKTFLWDQLDFHVSYITQESIGN